MHQPVFRSKTVGDADVFYREAGPDDGPIVLLLHGFPTASHMFRDLIPDLADRYHVIAPDLPGFGNTVTPPRGAFTYSFDKLAEVMAGFVDALGLDRFAIYIFDYGAPVGRAWRCAFPNASRPSSARTATPTWTASATPGDPGKPTGATRRPRTARPAAFRSRPTPSGNGNTSTAPTAAACRRTATRSTSPTWRGPAPRRSSST